MRELAAAAAGAEGAAAAAPASSRAAAMSASVYPWRRAQQIAHQPGYLGFFPAWPIEVGDGFVSSGEVTPSHLALMAMADSDVQVDEIDEDLPATVSVLLKATSTRSDFNHCCSVFLTALTVEPAVNCHC